MGDDAELVFRESSRFAGTQHDLIQHEPAQFMGPRPKPVVSGCSCLRVLPVSVATPHGIIEKLCRRACADNLSGAASSYRLHSNGVQAIGIDDCRLEGVSVKVARNDRVPVLPRSFVTLDGIRDSAKENSPSAVVVVSPVQTMNENDQAFLPRWGDPFPQAHATTKAVSHQRKFVASTNKHTKPVRGRPLDYAVLEKQTGKLTLCKCIFDE